MSVSNKELMEILNGYKEINKSIIAKNLDLIFSTRYKIKSQTGSKRIAILSKITDSSINTVMAWTNLGREKPKIPFLKLLMVAEAFGIPYEYLIRADDDWFDDAMQEKLYNTIVEMEDIYGND